MDAKQLSEMLKKAQEPKGYYFNIDKERVLDLLKALIANKDRYGYMACPCRLASGDKENDKDNYLPMCLSGTGCRGVRKLLLQSLCNNGME